MSFRLRQFVRMALIGLCIIPITLLSLFRGSLEEQYHEVVRQIPLTLQYHAEKDFVPTAAEDACFYGRPDVFNPVNKEPIPNVLHFITALQTDGADADLPFFAFLAMRAALQSQDPVAMKIHHTHLNEQAPYMQRLMRTDGHRIQTVRHDQESLQRAIPNSPWVQHQADVLRLKIMMEQGGVYMDTDVFALRSFENLRRSNRDVVMGHEGGTRFGLGNAVILARPGASFLDRWNASYSGFTPGEWNEYSVLLPKKLANDHQEEICTLSPEAFFWPTWTWHHLRHMHEVLQTEEEMEQVREAMMLNGGALYGQQLAYHAFHALGTDRPLSDLTEEDVVSNNTRFNLLVRKFLE